MSVKFLFTFLMKVPGKVAWSSHLKTVSDIIFSKYRYSKTISKTCSSGKAHWSRCFLALFYYDDCLFRISIFFLDHLVGELILKQDNQKVLTYINSKKDLQQVVQLHGPDFEYLSKSAYNYDIKWWIDSQPFNSSKDLHGLMWHHKYQDANVSHTIGVSIVAIRNESNSNSSEQPSTEVDFIDSTNSPVNTKFDNATDHSFKEKSSYSTFSNITNSDACKRTQVCGSFSRRITVKGRMHY